MFRFDPEADYDEDFQDMYKNNGFVVRNRKCNKLDLIQQENSSTYETPAGSTDISAKLNDNNDLWEDIKLKVTYKYK